MKGALRALTARPVFAIVAVATLALGFGVNAAIFAVTRTVLLTSLPYGDADRLVMINEANHALGVPFTVPVPANYLAWRPQVKAFDTTAAWRFVYFTLSGAVDRPMRVQGVLAEPTFFPLFGVAPMLGRPFTDADAHPGRDRVVILSYGFWRRQFNGDPSAVGRTMTVDGLPCTIVGVLPASFKFFRVLNRELDVWRPLVADPNDREHTINLYGRLATTASVDRARAELASAFASLPAEGFRAGWTTDVAKLSQRWTANQRPILIALEAAVALVMGIAAANVAGLVLTVAADRQKETAIRVALGATPWRLAAASLREMLLVAGAGAGIGLLLASWMVEVMNGAVSYQDINRIEPFRVDVPVMLFTSALAVGFALLFALLPSRSGGTHRQRRGMFVGGELALALALLASALALTRAAWSLHAMERGVDVDRIMTAQLSLSGPSYDDAARMTRFADEVLKQLANAPGVDAASLVNYPPLSSIATSYPIAIEGRPRVPGEEPFALCWIIAPRYFATAGIPLLSGRDFTAADAVDRPGVAIASRAFAARFWPNGDALGRQVTVLIPESNAFWIPRATRRPLTIVGIADNVRIDGIGGPRAADPQLYLPYSQSPTHILTLVVRPHGPPATAAAAIRNAVHATDPEQPTFDEKTLSDVRDETFARPLEISSLVGAFAVLALVLSGIGVYGVIAHSVTRRTREIGIRIALGAARSAVLRLVVREMVAFAAAGVAIGVPMAVGLGRIIQSRVTGEASLDAVTLIGAAALLVAVAVVAAYVPARRAAGLDPASALKIE